MPELDGIRLTTLIRQQPGQQLLPIVFLTGDPDPGASSKCSTAAPTTSSPSRSARAT